MDQHIVQALVGLAVIIIGSIGTLVTILVERIKRDLSENTRITRETRTATRSAALARVESERRHVVALELLIREREDRIAYLISRHPEIEATLNQYQPRRSMRPISEEAVVGDST